MFYPLEERTGKTIAFASVTIDEMVAIRGIRVMDGEKGLFVSMPQAKVADGYHDIAYPITSELRGNINKSVLDEFQKQIEKEPHLREYGRPEPSAAVGDIPSESIKVEAKVFPSEEAHGKKVSYANVTINDKVVIGGISVVDSAGTLKEGVCLKMGHRR